jgi:Tol biopolymer transport system component/imidazolonepropionase-like amidohydrolase
MKLNLRFLARLLWLPLYFIYTAPPLFSEPLGDSTQNISSTPKGWDITVPHGPAKTVEFETNEGTWISLDVSPDGRNIVFDLLGDIYIMPMSGGEATLLSGGPAMEVQPRFSPDGTRISYTSDRAGGDNIWVMDKDGKNAHAVTKESYRLLNNAVWTPDGQYLIARKHFVNTRSLGAGEMWMYHISGGDGVQLTRRRNWQQDAGEPCLSPDGRYLYYSEDVSPGGAFEYNRDPYGVIYVIDRLDRETGKIIRLANGNGGSVRPQASPDGKLLAFVRRVRTNTVLFLRDLESGEEWPVFDKLNRDAQETWAVFGVHPGFAWTPDAASIVISAKGKIWKVNVHSKEAVEIPFRVHVRQVLTEALRFPQKVAPEKFDVRMLRDVTTSPDGKSVVYCALGRLWTKSLPDGQPRQITDESNFEFSPAFSPDGKWVTYISWTDAGKGAVRKVKASGGKSIQLTRRKGTYLEPSFSRDGTKIVFRRLGGDLLRGQTYADEPGIYMMSAEGGDATFVTEEGSTPMFNKTGDRIFLESSEGERTALISVDLAGDHRRVHLVSENAQFIVPSPDERWVAFTERFNSYIATLPLTGQPVDIGPGTTNFPVKRITRDAGMYLHWSPDSRTVYWSLGPELFSRTLSKTFAFAGGGEDTLLENPDTTGLFIGFQAESDAPEGTTALVGATVITMHGDEVLKDALIVVDHNRIVSIGSKEKTSIPRGAKVIDVAGKYIMPGIIDVHAHGPAGSNGIILQENWAFYASLAFGVTTEHDPSNDTEMIFSASEMQKAGLIIAPRLFSTGTILYGAEGNFKAIVNNLDDARSHLRRLKAVGAFSVKSYNQPRREQRQQILAAARELNMMVVPEGGSTFNWNISQILDGHTGIEHCLPVSPLYKDVLTLFGQSKVGYTPTLIVSYGGIMGENYWYAHTNVWEDQRLLTYVPRAMVDARSRRRFTAPDDDWNHIDNARATKMVLDAGGKVQLGAHGQLQGLGAHWELWMLVQGGMTPMEAIRCATLYGAQYLGLDGDIGSLEPGKLADLIVMEKNPLENIRNSESIRYVMQNGRLFDAATMNQVGSHPVTRAPFYWEGGTDPGTTENMVDQD